MIDDDSARGGELTMRARSDPRVLRSTLLGCGSFFLLLAIAGGMLATWPSPYERRLPNGGFLRLTAMEYDGTRRVNLGNAWQRFGDWAVPRAVSAVFAGLFSFNPVGRKSIVLYGEYNPGGQRAGALDT